MKLLACALVLTLPALGQTTWYVDDSNVFPGTGTQADPYVTIQYAIDQATTLAGDTLSIAAGTYFENVDLTKILKLVGEPGPRPVVHGLGSGSTIKIDGVFGGQMELRHLCITGGEGTPVGSQLYGGGVYIRQGNQKIIDCVIEGNQDCDVGGAGLYALQSGLQLLDSIVRDNATGNSGGGLLVVSGAVTIDGCTFEDNRTIPPLGCGSGSGSRGGAIYVEGNHTITNSVFRRNASTNDGGAVFVTGNTTTIENCIFEDNGRWAGVVRTTDGGGLYGPSSMQVRDCVFRNNACGGQGGGSREGMHVGCLFESNESAVGGALYEGTALDCTFGLNRALVGAGGATFQVEVTRSVVWNNSAVGGAGGCAGAGFADRCTIIGNTGEAQWAGYESGLLSNSIVWGNRGPIPGGPVQQANSNQPFEYCLVEDHTGGGPGNLSDRPLLWGLHVGDGHLLPGSPAIDAADPALPDDSDGSRADIGALPYDPLYRGESARYCVAKETSDGCLPEVAAFGVPSLGGAPMLVSVTGVPAAQNGLLLLARSPETSPFFGGTLCLGAPLVRSTVATSLPGSGCGDVFLLALTSGDLAAMALAPGDLLFAQVWFRDPAQADGTAVGLSDALVMTVEP